MTNSERLLGHRKGSTAIKTARLGNGCSTRGCGKASAFPNRSRAQWMAEREPLLIRRASGRRNGRRPACLHSGGPARLWIERHVRDYLPAARASPNSGSCHALCMAGKGAPAGKPTGLHANDRAAAPSRRSGSMGRRSWLKAIPLWRPVMPILTPPFAARILASLGFSAPTMRLRPQKTDWRRKRRSLRLLSMAYRSGEASLSLLPGEQGSRLEIAAGRIPKAVGARTVSLSLWGDCI